MSVSAGTVEIDFRANDQTSEVIGNISSNMQGLQQDITTQNTTVGRNKEAWELQNVAVSKAYREQRFIRREFMLSHQPFYQTTALLGSIGHAGMRVNSIFLAYNAIQIRQAQADERVANAKKNLAEAIAKYGANSKQAVDAQEDLNKAQESGKQLAMQMPGMYAGLGMSALGFAGDIGRVALQSRLWTADMKKAGGIQNVLGNALMGLPVQGPTMPGEKGLGRAGGLAGRFGGMGSMRMMGGLAGIGMIGAGLALGGSQDPNQRIGSLFSTAAGGALAGSMIMPGIGTAVGAGLGLVTGLVQNYHEELANLFAGKGFLSDKDAGVNVNISVSAEKGTEVTEVSTVPYVIAGPVG